MQKQRPASNHLPELGKSISGVQKDRGHRSKKTKTRSIESNITRLPIGTKKRLSPTIRHLPLISLIPRLPTPENVKKKDEGEDIKLLGLIPPR